MNLPISIKQLTPITTKFDNETLKEVLTQDELRSELGLDPLEEGEKTAEDEVQMSQTPTDKEILAYLESLEVEDEVTIEDDYQLLDEEQAEDRVYRIGQESDSVHAVYISCAGTVDEHFDRVVESKRKVVKAVLDGGDVEERQGLVSELVKKLQSERGWKLEGNE